MVSESVKRNPKGAKLQSSESLEKKSRNEEKSKGEVSRKSSEYKRQLVEKQRLKRDIYNLREKQFRRFFKMAQAKKDGETGDNLLVFLERRIDNVVFRLKLALSRKHARQMIVHGHFLLNGKKIKSPSILVEEGDQVSFVSRSKDNVALRQAFDKKLNSGVRVPEWLELDAESLTGKILKLPTRVDIPVKTETSLVVELYSR